MLTEQATGSLEEQLELLYAEREWINQELGCPDAESVVDMVRSLEAQLQDFYKTYGGRMPVDSGPTAQLLSYVDELSRHLDTTFSEKCITFHMEDDKPVLRATWKETLNQGDTK
jgi:hypothetical protein